LVVAEKNLKRIQELYNSNFASEKELTEAQNDFNNAKSEYEGKKKILELYGGTPNTNDAIFRVTAPIDGYVVERTVNNGTQIRTDNNSSMFIISDLKTVWVWANVYESDMSKISIGDSVEVTTVAYPDKKYKGIINKIGNTLDPEARVVKVRIDIENPGELLKPEMFATVAIRSNTSGKMLGVPKNAVFIENSKNYIIKVNGNTFTKTEIKQGKETAQYIEILEGLSEGEKIVTDGALFIASSINNQ
jgi:cobalt-zinc-cadmium efflux system membrane fusion protein